MTTGIGFQIGDDVMPIFGGARMSVVEADAATTPDDTRCRWVSEFNGDAHELNLPTSLLRIVGDEDWSFDEIDGEVTCDGLMLMQDFVWLIEPFVRNARNARLAMPDWQTSVGVADLVRALTVRKHSLRI